MLELDTGKRNLKVIRVGNWTYKIIEWWKLSNYYSPRVDSKGKGKLKVSLARNIKLKVDTGYGKTGTGYGNRYGIRDTRYGNRPIIMIIRIRE